MAARSQKLPCPKCGLRVWGRAVLDRHLEKEHTPCPHCDGAYIRLDMHIRLRHPEKNRDDD